MSYKTVADMIATYRVAAHATDASLANLLDELSDRIDCLRLELRESAIVAMKNDDDLAALREQVQRLRGACETVNRTLSPDPERKHFELLIAVDHATEIARAALADAEPGGAGCEARASGLTPDARNTR